MPHSPSSSHYIVPDRTKRTSALRVRVSLGGDDDCPNNSEKTEIIRVVPSDSVRICCHGFAICPYYLHLPPICSKERSRTILNGYPWGVRRSRGFRPTRKLQLLYLQLTLRTNTCSWLLSGQGVCPTKTRSTVSMVLLRLRTRAVTRIHLIFCKAHLSWLRSLLTLE